MKPSPAEVQVRRYDRHQQMTLVRKLQPEAVSLALRELCPHASTEDEAGGFFRELVAQGCRAQYILYSPSDVRRFERLRRLGFFGHARPFALFVLGRYGEGRHGEPTELHAFLAECDYASFPWAVCCFGPLEAEAVSLAASLGGHVRIGFENNRWLPCGAEALNNAELICAELKALRNATGRSRPLASGDWVRCNIR